MSKIVKLSKISIAVFVGSLVLVSHTQPANAGWFTKDTYLGRMTVSDNLAYWRAQGRIGLSTPPWDRNQLCQWKYGRDNVWGKAVSSWGSANWQTDCYRWRWFWQ
ncbi:hypothetical protein PCC9214_04514 [Planktothrix tepida]|uniref:Uncharacterized protein n=2 Tax=Planktothrix TaxID=54304 RepID=A0A1J1LPK3_9CYAN|nr:hypothetical protein NO713_00933 [Planktothrix pseudagardhii]CAD5979471.1 hypothetical protein PCC9214_04514 [Planktothrix tepida]CUR33481.1 exported hypothetical protein [Planktothrix tepida PCC 9214]